MSDNGEDALTHFNLANNHNTGEGVAQDKAEAVKWYTMAAAQGDTEAKSILEGMK